MELIILRGLPGSGKSTLANTLASADCVFEADKFMINKKGEYSFDPKRSKECHSKARTALEKAMKSNKTPLVLSNTNTQEWEFKEAEEMAAANGYNVFHLVVENRRGSKSIHCVPEEIIEKMENNIRKSLKLK